MLETNDSRGRGRRTLGVIFFVLAPAILVTSFAVDLESTRGVAIPVAMMFLIFSIILLSKSGESANDPSEPEFVDRPEDRDTGEST